MNATEIVEKIRLASEKDNLKDLTELFYQSIQHHAEDEKMSFEIQYQNIVKEKISFISKELSELKHILDNEKQIV